MRLIPFRHSKTVTHASMDPRLRGDDGRGGNDAPLRTASDHFPSNACSQNSIVAALK
ncbi:hypothetical protein ABIE51_003814 [Lysobacter sp. OAE881]